MKKKILILFPLTVVTCGLYAQRGIVTTGGQATGTGGSVSYSIGQVDFSSALGSGGTVMQGLQHPFEISVITSVEREIDFPVAVYPNPVTKGVTIEVQNFLVEKARFSLCDLQGREIIKEQVVSDRQTFIPMEELTNGVYFIRISGGDSRIKTVKVIKNQ